MKAIALDGGSVEILTEMLDNLKVRLRGQVIVAGGTGYDEGRTVWNAMIDGKPSIVIRCICIDDVIECVRFAREHGLLLVMPVITSRPGHIPKNPERHYN